jgi:DNA-binding CsgD family transcriptional regulator
MMGQDVPPASERPMLGRAGECEAIRQLVDAVRDGFGGVTVLIGEPGVGKSRLLRYAADAAGDLTVVRLVGVQSEKRLAYGALHRLLRPFLARTGNLPAQQQDALNAAFGLTGVPPSDRFLVGLATLTLLADVAFSRPMLCLVDDVHWLDRESAEVLAFVARRLHADSLGLIFAARGGSAHLGFLDGLNVTRLDGLAVGDARALLALGVAGHLDQAVADRVVAGTAGNPLALLELARHLGAEQLAGVAPLPEPLPVNRLIEEYFRGDVAALPADTQTLLLLMAATPTDDQATLWRAAGVLGLSMRAAAPAVIAGVLRNGTPVEFRHPLFRSAVYSAAAIEDRRRIHAALAATSVPDRSAWHRAEATDGVADDVAAELEAASERARARGGYSEQALFLSRAAELTTDPAKRAERYLAAAVAKLKAGDVVAGQALLDLARPDLDGPLAQVKALRIQGAVDMFRLRVDLVPATLLAAAVELGSGDPGLSGELMYEAMQSAIHAQHLVKHVTRLDVARAAAEVWHDPRALDGTPGLLMKGLAMHTAYGYARGAPVIQEALSRLRTGDGLRELDSPFAVVVSLAADEVWDQDAKNEIIERLASVNRSDGALYGLSMCLIVKATGELYQGRFGAASDLYAEADGYFAAMAFPGGSEIHRVQLYAWTGRDAQLRAAVAAIDSLAAEHGLGGLAQIGAYARSLLDLALGRYQDALDRAWKPFEDDTISVGNQVLPLLIEAAGRVGDRSAAAAALRRLEERATIAATPWALGILARCRALTADGDVAEGLYQESIHLLDKAPVAVERAWSQLVFGEWLRRRKRRADARVQLRAAFESFDAWGALPFAERARTELLATGETARRRRPGTRFDLTPQERQVASLAASGLTNAEIATRLFITTSTVEFHLNKVFRKLHITSRKQIASMLESHV